MRARVLAQRAAAVVLIAASCLAASDLRLVDAVKRRDPKTVASLIQQRADVNAAQPDGATALGWAVYLGAGETAELLLAAGLSPEPLGIVARTSTGKHPSRLHVLTATPALCGSC